MKPEIGKTYMMTTAEPRTIIFKFVNIGEYDVDGQILKRAIHFDLASPYAVIDIQEHK